MTRKCLACYKINLTVRSLICYSKSVCRLPFWSCRESTRKVARRMQNVFRNRSAYWTHGRDAMDRRLTSNLLCLTVLSKGSVFDPLQGTLFSWQSSLSITGRISRTFWLSSRNNMEMAWHGRKVVKNKTLCIYPSHTSVNLWFVSGQLSVSSARTAPRSVWKRRRPGRSCYASATPRVEGSPSRGRRSIKITQVPASA